MQPARHENLRNSVLLIIEPDAATRSGMKRLLETTGHAVTAAANEQQAAKAAARHNYDLILFDSNQPPPTSVLAAHKLRRNIQLADMPMLVISVHEKFTIPLDKPEVDKFTVAYLTDLDNFNELEKLINCLLTVYG